MIFEKWLIPDLVEKHYYDITPETVKKMGASAVLCDIDNTLATYDDATPPDGVVKWIGDMRAAGIEIAFVSNNSKDRVEMFNRRLGCVALARAGKPKTAYLRAALELMGIDKSRAMLLGDQLLTDCAAAKRFGIPAVIVPPIKDKKTVFFRFKRLLEAPYMKKYYKLHKSN